MIFLALLGLFTNRLSHLLVRNNLVSSKEISGIIQKNIKTSNKKYIAF